MKKILFSLLGITDSSRHIPKDKNLSETPSSQRRPIATPLLCYHKQFENRDRAVSKESKSVGNSMK